MLDKRAHFEAIAKDWDAMQPPERQQKLHRLLAAYKYLFDGAARILEIGTGTGSLIPAIKTLAPTAGLVSIDLAYAMLQQARLSNPEVNLLQADGSSLPFTSVFDLIICHNAFPHFDEPVDTLRSMLGFLGPGGHLLILHDQSRQAVNGIHQRVGGAIARDLLPDPAELEAMMQQAGFVELEVEDGEKHFHAIGQRPM